MRVAAVGTFLCVLVFTAVFAVMPRESRIPPIKVTYPQMRDATFDYTQKLPNKTITKATCDELSNTLGTLICSPFPTGIHISSEKDACAAGEKFLRENETLFGVDASNLHFEDAYFVMGKWVVHFRQREQKYDVIGSMVTLTMTTDGNVYYIKSSAKPFVDVKGRFTLSQNDAVRSVLSYVEPQSHTVLEAERMFAPMPTPDGYRANACWWLKIRTVHPLGLWVAWVDANTGEILRILDELPTVSGTISGNFLPSYYDDTPESIGFGHHFVRVDVVTGYANASGYFSGLGGTTGNHEVYSTLRGSFSTVEDHAYPVAEITSAVSGDIWNHFWNMGSSSPYRTDQINTFYHVTWIHDWYKNYFGFSAMDYSVPTRVNDTYMTDNAYWDGEAVNFCVEGDFFWNLALFSDVIYHEYTHGVTGNIYPGDMLPYEGQSGAINEGLSDYFPCSIFNNRYMGEKTNRSDPGYYMRDLDNVLTVDDAEDEVHFDAQIVSGAWWMIRAALGVGYADSLAHFARYLYPVNFNEYLDAYLSLDDDDGNLTNGTPNAGTIYMAYHAHGIGPDIFLNLMHMALSSTENTSTPYPVMVNVTSFFEIDSVCLFYRVGSPIWTRINLAPVTGNIWSASIPAQPLGSTVQYYLGAYDVMGNSRTSPVDAPIHSHSFSVIVDTIPPTISHMPITRGSIDAWSPKVCARVLDNGTLGNILLEFSINGVAQTPISLFIDTTNGMYTAQFPSTVRLGDIINYRITARDISAASNAASFPSDESFIEFQVERTYFDGMEWGGYDFKTYSVRQYYQNAWHLSRETPHTGEYCFKLGDTLSTVDYADSIDACLETPAIYRTPADTLTFWHKIDAEISTYYSGYAWDGGIVEISTNGGSTWTQLQPIGSYPYRIRRNDESPFEAETQCYSGTTSWAQAKFRLLGGVGYVKFRFHFGSDGATTKKGWFIDDIAVTNNNWTAIWEVSEGFKPQALSLVASPNPFNAAQNISIALPEDGNVSVCVFDITGKLVAQIFNGEAKNGFLNLRWQPKSIGSGIYFIRATTQKSVVTKEIIFVK